MALARRSAALGRLCVLLRARLGSPAAIDEIPGLPGVVLSRLPGAALGLAGHGHAITWTVAAWKTTGVFARSPAAADRTAGPLEMAPLRLPTEAPRLADYTGPWGPLRNACCD